MAEFNYTAVNKEGLEKKGVLEAVSLNDALNKIRQMGLYPAQVNLSQEEKNLSFSLKTFFAGFSPGAKVTKIKPEDLVIFTRQIAVLLNAGLPLVKGLHTLQHQRRFEALNSIIGGIADMIESGKTFSEALSHYPASFSKIYVNIIKSGESGGALDQVLKRLADYLERNLRLTQRIRSALIYPALVMVISIGILGFIIVFIIPKFMTLFEDSGLALPIITVFLLNLSKLIMHRWYLLIAGVGALWFGYGIVIKNYNVRYAHDKLILNLPVFGPLIQKITASRFSRTLSTLLSGGVPILKALELTKQVSGNEVVAKTVGQISEAVREGGFISRVLEDNEVFPQLMINMISVGEETGSLDKMLSKVADTYEEEVEIATSTLTSLLEPVLVIVMGVVVGIIVLAMFLPLITLVQSLTA